MPMILSDDGEYTLSQRYFVAKQNGLTHVTLSLKEAENTLEKIKQLDEKLAACMEFLPPEAWQRLFPPPDESTP